MTLKGVLLFPVAVLLTAMTFAAPEARTVNLLVLQDGESPQFHQMTQMVKNELGILADKEWQIRYIEGPAWTGDWEPERMEELLEFPCNYSFKAVGEAGGDFVPAMLARVAQVIGRAVEPHEHSVRPSAKGKYESVSIMLFVQDSAQLYAVYEAMNDDERVRYLL